VIVFESLEDVVRCLEAVATDADAAVVRVKNRYGPDYDAAETAGYRSATSLLFCLCICLCLCHCLSSCLCPCLCHRLKVKWRGGTSLVLDRDLSTLDARNHVAKA
jgi:hypothetical protein